MKYSTYILKLMIFIYAAYLFSIEGRITAINVAIYLIIAAVNIYKEKLDDTLKISIISLILICIGIYYDRTFSVFLIITAYDFMLNRSYIFYAISIAAEIYLFFNNKSMDIIILFSMVCGMFAYVIGKYDIKEKENISLLDNERRLRYELESVRAKLINSSRETAYLAEVKERNRIARDIHDSVGHTLSGILIQLQAAMKLYEKNPQKSKNIFQNCIKTLSGAVTMLRDTVHNIKPNTSIGSINEEFIKTIINEFGFCKINYKAEGSFRGLSADIIKAVGTNIREALSNASKYSSAEIIDILININDMYIRTSIKDNGCGCHKIKEGLGISGMRERINKYSGSFSVSGDNGFTIVFIIPLSNWRTKNS